MKKKLKKNLALFLVITLSLSTSYIALAHTHTYTINSKGIMYTSKDAYDHTKAEYVNYICVCGDSYGTVTSQTTEPHIFTTYSYSGYNYHSGSIHKFEYARNCISCRYRDAYFQTKSCSGPPCTIPY